MADLVRSEADGDHRYRITRTHQGYLITSRSKNELGLYLACEWLHRTPEAANACLDAIICFNALWRAMTKGYPTEALLQKSEGLNAAHSQLCQQLDDSPLVGQEVKALRAKFEEADA